MEIIDTFIHYFDFTQISLRGMVNMLPIVIPMWIIMLILISYRNSLKGE